MPAVVVDALLVGAAVLCVVAQLFIVRAALRPGPDVAPTGPREAADGPTAAPQALPRPHRVLEVAWAILPGLLLAAALWGAWRARHPEFPPPSLP